MSLFSMRGFGRLARGAVVLLLAWRGEANAGTVNYYRVKDLGTLGRG